LRFLLQRHIGKALAVGSCTAWLTGGIILFHCRLNFLQRGYFQHLKLSINDKSVDWNRETIKIIRIICTLEGIIDGGKIERLQGFLP
jgi:hypothetical protein